jgi:hypothetical protein
MTRRMMSLIGTVYSSLLRISRSDTLGSVGRRLIRLYEFSFGWRFSGLGYHDNLGALPLYRKVA